MVATETSCFSANLLIAASTATFPVLRQTDVQSIQIFAETSEVVSGNFKLGITVNNQIFSTNVLSYNSTANEIKAELENLPSLDFVQVNMNVTFNSVMWSVDFVAFQGKAPDLEIISSNFLVVLLLVYVLLLSQPCRL